MIPSPASLLAGATDPHGAHERLEGWDRRRRLEAPDKPGALAYGRHAAQIDTRPQEKT